MPQNPTFLDFGTFLSKYFPQKVQKISIDAGFTCPNRDGMQGSHGCTYCNNRSFSPNYTKALKPISQQLEEGKRFFSAKYPSMKYLAYFQSYTNTYANLATLTSRYEDALSVDNVVGIIIGTRPDCISDELLDYLAELSSRTFVLIEYGIESTDNRLLASINRGHTYGDAVSAIERTAKRDILIGAHLICGLPNDTEDRMLNQAGELSALPLNVLKLHQLQIIRGTQMAKEYMEEPEHFHLFSVTEYIRFSADFLTRLRPDLVVERFTAQAPKNMLIAPNWGLKNYEFVNLLENYMKEKDLWQGKYYKP